MKSVGIIVALGIATVMACRDDDHVVDDTQFREDVIWCEDSVAHLQECCGAFDSDAIQCQHFYERDTGCNSTSIVRVDPAYTETESRCIRDRSCDEILSTNICARALAAGKARQSSVETDNTLPDGAGGSTSSSTSSGSAATGPVCP